MVASVRISGSVVVLVLVTTLLAGCAGSAPSAPAPAPAGVGGNPPAVAPAPAASAAGPVSGGQAPAPTAAGQTSGNQAPLASAAASMALNHGQPTPGPGDVAYGERGLNPYVDTWRDHLSTFGLDVDTASYTLARSRLQSGALPDPSAVRVEEWVNFFDQAYAAPETGVFAIHADGAPAPFLTGSGGHNEVLLRVGVKARAVSRHDRPDAALTFVIDTSGSMADGGRLELVKSSLRLLVNQLRSSDRVGIVAFTTDARIVLDPTPGDQRDRIMRAIDQLQPQATTNVDAGLRLGYQLARECMVKGGINRVIIASDGVANTGDTQAQGILEDVHRDAAAGIQLVAVGVGMGTYNDALLEQLADKGDGFYAYIDTEDEAHRLFVERLVSTIDTVALDAKAQVDFNPDTVAAYRLIGYENRAIADRDYRNDNVPAGTIGAGHAVTVLYGLRLRDGVGQGDRIATVGLRWTDPSTKTATETGQDVHGSDVAGSWGNADPHLRLDALVAASAEVFRGSPWIENFSVRQLADAAQEVRGDLPRTSEVDEFLELLRRAGDLAR